MKRIIITFACILSGLCATAQPGNNQQKDRRNFSPEEFKQKMEEFVTREAKLTPAEAQKFYPLLHEMLGKQRKNNDTARNLMHNCNDETSENEYEAIIDKCTSLELQNKKIEREYYKKFHSVLTWKKIHKVRTALFKFHMDALKRFSPHKDGNRHRDRHHGPVPK